MPLPPSTWDVVKIELEINGKIVDSKTVTNYQYDWEVKKMKLRAQLQEYPWAIFKTKTRSKLTRKYQKV